MGVVEGFQKTEYIRGPVQLDEVYAIKSEDKGKTKTPIRGEIANITIDTNALYQQLKKQKSNMSLLQIAASYRNYSYQAY